MTTRDNADCEIFLEVLCGGGKESVYRIEQSALPRIFVIFADTENDRIPAFLCTDGVFGMDRRSAR